jgi:hypothetical protein
MVRLVALPSHMLLLAREMVRKLLKRSIIQYSRLLPLVNGSSLRQGGPDLLCLDCYHVRRLNLSALAE